MVIRGSRKDLSGDGWVHLDTSTQEIQLCRMEYTHTRIQTRMKSEDGCYAITVSAVFYGSFVRCCHEGLG